MYSQPANSVQTVVAAGRSGGAAAAAVASADRPPRRSYGFWLLVSVVMLVAVFNLLITLTLLSVLRVSVGMHALQVVDRDMVFSGTVDLGSIFKPDGTFIGYREQPMSINGDGPAISLLVSAAGQGVSLSGTGVSVSGVSGASVASHDSDAPFFSTAFPNFGLPAGVRSLRVQSARSGRVVSPVDRPLRLRSATQTHLRGAEGTHIRGGSVVLSADQELFLKSVNGSVELWGGQGVWLDVRAVPWSAGRRVSESARAQYRLCACMPSGRLFRIPVPLDDEQKPAAQRITCANAALYGDSDPCHHD